jgi:hypothetical protein
MGRAFTCSLLQCGLVYKKSVAESWNILDEIRE